MCLLVISLSPGAVADDDGLLSEPLILSILRRGYVDYKYCEGTCAGLGVPYRYRVISASDIERVIEEVIQSIGFSLNFNDSEVPLSECTSQKPRDSTADNSIKTFRTEFFPLEDHILARLGVTRTQLKLDPNPAIIYEFQIAGCYKTLQNGAATPFIDPGASLQTRSGGWTETLYQTRVDLVLTTLMRKRGTKGAFVEVKEKVYPKLLLDGIKVEIEKKAGEIPYKVWQSNFRGEVSF